jgi:ABC-type multidrug transport system permease subunit
MVSPSNLTCHEYFGSFVASAGGALSYANAVGVCSFCPLARTDELLMIFKIEYKDRWLNLSVIFIYIGFNVAATFGVYLLARVPKGQRTKKA